MMMSTYDKLLEQADTLIQKNGYAGFSYADLAERLGIRKASIHHHFPAKSDLGVAYCDKKNASFQSLESFILTQPEGRAQLLAYLEAFSGCADRGEMCGVYAMLSDYNLFPAELQQAVTKLAQTELRILNDILDRGAQAGKLKYHIASSDMAVIVCNALKGALMLNCSQSNDSYVHTVQALSQMLDAA